MSDLIPFTPMRRGAPSYASAADMVAAIRGCTCLCHLDQQSGDLVVSWNGEHSNPCCDLMREESND